MFHGKCAEYESAHGVADGDDRSAVEEIQQVSDIGGEGERFVAARGHARSSMASEIERNDAKTIGEMGELPTPVVRIAGEPVHEEHGRIAAAFVGEEELNSVKFGE